jgi:AraC-like DNA-binding protein
VASAAAGAGVELARLAHAGSRWELASRAPRAALRPYVRSLRGFDERADGPRCRREFPEPWVVLIFDFCDSGAPLRVALGGDDRHAVRARGGFAAGLGDAFATTLHDGGQRGIQVDVTPTAARRLFGLPLSEIAGRVVALRDLLPEVDLLCERLDAARDWAARLDLVEALLARRILGASLDTARVDHALARIEAAGGAVSVGALARELGHSRRHLLALFRDQVGIGPKLLARLVRFERAMRHVRASARVDWADLALAHGYFDQSHLARDVKRFTGLAPTGAHRSLGAQVTSVQDGAAG